MKKFLFLGILLILPLTAQADFSLNGSGQTTAPQPVMIHREKMRPSLEIINDRYIPADIKQKYKMTDDYVEMTQTKPPEPIVVEPPPQAVAQKKKRLEIIGGPPPVIAPVVATVAEAKPAQVPVPAERIETWRARKGEFLKDVLKRWADRGGTDFTWTAAESPKISQEYSYVGTFETAVAGLMKQDSGPLKMKFSEGNGENLSPASDPLPITPGQAADMRMTAQTPEAPVQPGKTWFAAGGSSLEGTLRAWAETEGASLIWQADQAFAVPTGISDRGTFEQAVEGLLSKYERKKQRPVGQLYKNPVSGEKVLVIRTDKTG